MSEQTAIVESSLALIERMATDPNCDPAKLRELLAVQKEWEANEHEKEFAADFSAFQAECPIIAPLDQGNKNTYAKLDRIHRETRPLRKQYGLSVVWSETTMAEDGAVCRLRGHLVHRSGYMMPVAYDIPIPAKILTRDGKAVTNVTQAMGSATSYARRYAEGAVFGIVTGKDDDGNGCESRQLISELAVAELRKMCKRRKKTEAGLCKWLQVDNISDMTEAQYQQALAAFGGAAK